MAKKTRISGIDSIFQSTEPEANPEEKKIVPKEKKSRINFDAPVSLKKRLQLYCLQNNISIKDFIIQCITERLDKA
ncbi:hypothetical protein EZS27_019890 [termite gut metagenome]|jgi:predicted HicB family RNase H-like nuclease|uniref:Uncharacterized protein n=1 Tax=termite gut metagenome TaxID=433724 RepID=A0A5J4RCV6_9ZZZZ